MCVGVRVSMLCAHVVLDMHAAACVLLPNHLELKHRFRSILQLLGSSIERHSWQEQEQGEWVADEPPCAVDEST
jgi:hypothetical protein